MQLTVAKVVPCGKKRLTAAGLHGIFTRFPHPLSGAKVMKYRQSVVLFRCFSFGGRELPHPIPTIFPKKTNQRLRFADCPLRAVQAEAVGWKMMM
jgi:hypothetical protein